MIDENEDGLKELQKLVQAEVRNVFDKTRRENEKETKKLVEDQVAEVIAEFDAAIGRISRVQGKLHDTVDTVAKKTEELFKSVHSGKESAKRVLERINKLEYVSLDNELSAKVQNFVRAPVKYILKSIIGFE